ncbi:MAG TPA: DNA polymerase IV [Erysipelotrichaceae bacterium]|nr:DNA polymerase IV [Erysipelotrichaceae bacterium]
MAKVIVHIDLNAFYARCEEIKNPSLENKPIAVGHEGRAGIVSTCSYKAREFGVRSGMPTFKAKNLCPQLILIPGDYRFYSVMSKTFFNFVKRYTKLVEMVSVDECFADFTEVIKGQDDVISFFRKMQMELFNETQLTCSIGVSVTRFLAKMASNYQKPMGLTIIRRRDIKKIIFPLKIEEMFGIGKKTAPKLKSLGINTIGDLYVKMQNQEEEVKHLLGKFYDTLKEWLEGKGSDEIEIEKVDPKSIGNSTTLPYDTDDINDVNKYLLDLAKEVSLRAKKEEKLGYTIQIVVKDHTFKSYNKSLTLENPFNDWNTIYEQAKQLYATNFRETTIRLVGITLQNLIDIQDMAVQMSLFDYEKYEEESATKLLINKINRSLKKPLLKRASEVKKDGNS